MLQLLDYMFVTLGFACPLMSRNNSDHLKYVKMAGSTPPPPFFFCADSVLSASLSCWGKWMVSGGRVGYPVYLPDVSYDIVPLCGSLDYCITIVAVLLLLLLIVYFRAAVSICLCFVFIWDLLMNCLIYDKSEKSEKACDNIDDNFCFQPPDNFLYFVVGICCNSPI